MTVGKGDTVLQPNERVLFLQNLNDIEIIDNETTITCVTQACRSPPQHETTYSTVSRASTSFYGAIRSRLEILSKA
jgi:hypothetical protein